MSREQRVLAYVNRVRARFEAPQLKALPKGARCVRTHCPIAEAMPVPATVNTYRIVVGDGPQQLKFDPPLYVRDWISDFDAGLFPELIA